MSSPVESECSRCHRKFHASSEEATLCPDCLKEEFHAAPVMRESERAAIAAEYAKSSRRQIARAERMNRNYRSDSVFGIAGRMRCALGVAIFLGCVFIFMLGDSEGYATPLSQLDLDSQRVISIVLCWVAAGLIFISFQRHKVLVTCVGLVMLVSGWLMPEIWRHEPAAVAEEQPAAPEPKPEKKERPVLLQTEDPNAEEGQALSEDPVLSEADLAVFREGVKNAPHLSHYAIYMDNQDSSARAIVREALTRQLEAEYTRAYTRAMGALYVVTNAKGQIRNISRILSRYGRVAYARPAEGIYEVHFMPDRANMVCRYTPDVLNSPTNPAFVSANLSELSCLDPMRVRAAAISLKNSNVPVLRRDIHAALCDVLSEPWTSEPDTYSALVEALVTYAPEGDARTVEMCRRYFQLCRSQQRGVSSQVLLLLIRETPDEMVEPIVDMWAANPVVWGRILSQLGSRAEEKMLELLSRTDSIQLIGAILKYIQDFGTKKSLPVVEKYIDHPDSLISHTARATLSELKNRLPGA